MCVCFPPRLKHTGEEDEDKMKIKVECSGEDDEDEAEWLLLNLSPEPHSYQCVLTLMQRAKHYTHLSTSDTELQHDATSKLCLSKYHICDQTRPSGVQWLNYKLTDQALAL